ncbi:hypothetical protein EYF80_058505 [Liparis tanakae]|uniref:Uncharacterized protein n=1 Tax=Liparis tanakae TaxID=230148 RepID=A0A4Z2ESU3_9TELE|nr:hypothetical protein EYF80_058505 [Liparis tanakae]
MRVPPAQRSLTAFSLEVCGRQQEQVLLKGCLSTELKEMSGSERVRRIKLSISDRSSPVTPLCSSTLLSCSSFHS